MTTGNSKPAINQGWLRAVLLLFAFITASVLVGVLCGFIMMVPAFSPKGSDPTALLHRITIVSLFATTLAAIGVTFLFRRYIDRKSIISLGFEWKSFEPDALTGFAFAVALLGIGTLLLFAKGHIEWTEFHFATGDLLTGLLLMILVALSEEIVFRGYILTNLLASMNKWAALGISAALFAFAHATNPGISVLAVINVLVAGLLLGINFIYTRNIWFAVCFHFGWNFLQGPILGYEVSGLQLQSLLKASVKGPGWITGGSFGLEGSLLTTILFLIAVLVLYLIYEKKYTTAVSVKP